MTTILALWTGNSLVNLVIAVVVVMAVVAIAAIGIRRMGWTIDPAVSQIFWIILIAALVIIGIRIVVSL